MKKKLTLLLVLLAFCVSGVWAVDPVIYSILDGGTTLPSRLGFFSNLSGTYYKTYQSDAAAGLTITSDGYALKEGYSSGTNYGNCLCVSSGSTKTTTLTISAPTGFKIKGYTLKGKGGNGDKTFTFTSSNSTSKLFKSLTYDTFEVTGLDTSTETITITSNDTNKDIWINTFTIDLQPAGTALTVTYKVRFNNETVHTCSAVNTYTGTEPSLPPFDIRSYCTYAYYSDEACTSAIATLAAENTTVYAKCTLSGAPFDFASTIEDANTNNKWKEFKLANNTNYVYYNGSSLAYTATDLSTTDGYQWALIGNPYGYKIYNKGADGYLSAVIPTENKGTTSEFTFNSTGVEFELYKYYQRAANDHFVSVVKGTNEATNTATVLNYANGWKIWCGKNNTDGFLCYRGLMNGLSTSFLLPIDVPTTFNVTYNVNNYAGTQIATANIEVAAGDSGDDAANHLPSALNKANCTYSYSPSTVSETNNVITVTFTYTPDYGFDVYNNYASISTWNFLKLNNKDYIVYDSGSNPNVKRSTNLPDGDNASWAFVGNPYEGIKIYNKGAGNSVWLTSATPDLNDGTTDGGGNTAVTLASSGDKQVWYLSSSTYFTKGFFIGNNDGYRLNGRSASTNVSYWMGGADGGSTFMTIENVDYHANVVSEFAAWFTNNVGSYFGLSQSTYDTQSANYTSYSSAATYKQYMELKAAVEAGIKYPSTGNYLIKNYFTAKYITASNSKVNVGEKGDANTIVHLTNNGNGTYSFALQGKYVGTPTKDLYGTISWVNAPVNFTWELADPGYMRIKIGDVYVWNAGGTMTGWVGGNQGSMWEIEDVEPIVINLNAAEDNTGAAHTYATLCVPFNITGLTGVDNKEVKAYAPTKSGDFIVPGDGATTINAGTPVLLIGEEGATSVTATIGSSYVTAPTTTNALTGVFSGQTIDTCAETGVNYVLGKDATNSNRIGFYHVNNENFALNANRAYLKLDGSGDPAHVKGYVISFDFDDDDATGVTSPLEETGEGASIYNLSGQRLNKMQKGINIVNGKKVLK